MRSYGPTGQDDRALGSLTNDPIGTLIYGASFQNNTGFIITDLDIHYLGEQWRRGANTAVGRLYFDYSLDASSLTDGTETWTNFAGLTFTSPKTGTSSSKLNGNLGENNDWVEGLIPGLTILNGDTFWIRYRDLNISGQDHGLAVDNFQLTPLSSAVPLPASVLLLASGLIGLIGFRKRVQRG